MAKMSKGEYCWVASGACLEEATGERALGVPPLADPTKATAADMPKASIYGNGLIPLLEKKAADLKKLGLPECDPFSGDLGLIKAALHHLDESVKEFAAANVSAHKGDVKGFIAHWILAREHDTVADELFCAFDLPPCAVD